MLAGYNILCRRLLVDYILLGYGQEIVYKPVEHQARCKIQKHKSKDHGQKHHYFCLGGICRARCHFLLQKHGATHEKGENRDATEIGDIHAYHEAIRCGQITNPEHKGGMLESDGLEQHLVQCTK